MNGHSCDETYQRHEGRDCSHARNIVLLIPIFCHLFDWMSWDDDSSYDGIPRTTQRPTKFLMASLCSPASMISTAHRQLLSTVLLPCPIGGIHRRFFTSCFSSLRNREDESRVAKYSFDSRVHCSSCLNEAAHLGF